MANANGKIIPVGIAKNGTRASLDLNQVYYFKNLNKKLNEAQGVLNNTTISYAIEKADYRAGSDEEPDAADLKLAAGTTTASVLAQFVNGKSYPVYANIKYASISHKLVKQADNKYLWDKKGTTTYNDIDLKVYAGTNLTLKPWSTVADGYVSYGWIKKISGIQKDNSGTITGRTYMDNNEIKWVNGPVSTPTTAATIDLRNIQVFYGKQLINLATPSTTTYANYRKEDLGGITAANGCGVTFRPKSLNAAGNPNAWSDLNVWVEAADGQISDYFDAKPIVHGATTSEIEVKQLSDRLAGNITVYLCMELIDQLGHSEIVKLPLSIVDAYTKSYNYNGSVTAGDDTTDRMSSVGWSFVDTANQDNYLVRIAE